MLIFGKINHFKYPPISFFDLFSSSDQHYRLKILKYTSLLDHLIQKP